MTLRAAVRPLQAIAIAVIAACLLVMPQLKYLALHQSFYDLGQYATVLYAVGVNGETGQTLQAHAHLLAWPYALVMALAQTPASLLAIQSLVLVGSAALAGRVFSRTGAGTAMTGALIYLLSIAVWFNALFEFHFEHLLFPLILVAFLLAERPGAGRAVLLILIALLLSMVKETYALCGTGLGLYLILARRAYVTGAIIVVVTLGYFYFATTMLIPHFSRGLGSGELWQSAFGDLGRTVPEMLGNLLTHPIDTARRLGDPRKALYVVALAGAFAFVWLRRPAFVLVGLPVLLLALLSSDSSHYYLGTQYSAAIVAALFVATAVSLSRFEPVVRERLTGLVIVTSVVVLVLFGPSPISRLFVTNETFAFGYSAYLPSGRDARIRAAIDSVVPADSAIPVATQNTVVTDRLAARRALMAFPAGVIEPYRLPPAHRLDLWSAVTAPFDDAAPEPAEDLFAQYVVIDRTRPLGLYDDDCVYRRGACTDLDAAKRFEDELAQAMPSFDTVLDHDGLLILKRR